MPEEIIEINARMDDDFNDGLLSGDKWLYNSGIGTLSESGGVLSVSKTSAQSGIMTQVRSSSALIGDFDFSIKMRRTDVNSNTTTIGFFLGTYDDSVPNNASGYLIGMVGSQWKVTYNAGGTGYTDQFVGMTNVQDIWYSIRVTRTGSQWKFYIDEVLAITISSGVTAPAYFSTYRYWKESSATTQYGTLQYDDLKTQDFSSKAHIGQTLPFKTCLPVSKDTKFLAHYDITKEENLYGIRPSGMNHSLNFPNSSSYVEMKRVFSTTEFTVFGSFRLNSLPDSEMDIIGQYLPGDTGRLIITINDSTGVKKLRAFIGGNAHFSARNLSIGVWYNFCVTRNSAGVSNIYFDGVLDSSGTLGTAVPTNTPTRLGSNSGGLGVFLDGNLGEIYVFNKALTANAVADIHLNGVISSMNGLVLQCDANDAEGTLLFDRSPNKNHGYLKGNTKWDWGRTVATLREDEGRFGGAIAIEEPTVNGILDPAFNSFAGYTDVTYTAVDEPESLTGKAMLTQYLTVGFNDAARFRPIIDTWVSTGTHTISFYAKGMQSTIGKSPKVFTGSSWYTSSQKLTSSYTRFVFESLPFGSSSGGLGIGLAGSMLGDEFLIHSPQVESKAFATSFVMGSRPDPNLQYIIDPIKDDFTVSFWHVNKKSTATAQHVFGMRDLSRLSSFDYFTYPSLSTLRITNQINGVVVSNSSHAGFDIMSDWAFLSFVNNVTENTFKIFHNGSLVGTLPSVSAIFERVYVGIRPSDFSASACGNTLMDELRIDSLARTDDEIKQWYYSQSPFFPKGIHRVYA